MAKLQKSESYEKWLTLLASASVISLFVVMPFTLGHFVFFGLEYLHFFSIADFLLFSAVPLLSVFVLFPVYYYMIPAMEFLLKFPDKIAPKSGKSRGLSKFRRILSSDLTNRVVMALSLLGTSFFFAIAVPLSGLALIGCLVAISFVALFTPVFKIPRLIQLSLLFVLGELFLFAWGYNYAEGAYFFPKKVELSIGEKKFDGNLAFSSNSGILLFDNNSRITFYKFDGNIVVSSVIIRRSAASSCLNWEWVQYLRDLANRECRSSYGFN